MKKTKNDQFKPGDWVVATGIAKYKYAPALVKKVLKDGKLQVVYGSYMNEIVIQANKCKLLKRS